MTHLFMEFHLRTFSCASNGREEARRRSVRRAATQFLWLRHQFMEQVGADVTLHTWVPVGPSGFLMFLVESIESIVSEKTWSLSILSPIDKTRRNHHSLSLTNLTINCDHPNIDKFPRETSVFPRPCRPTPRVPCWVKNRPVPSLLYVKSCMVEHRNSSLCGWAAKRNSMWLHGIGNVFHRKKWKGW